MLALSLVAPLEAQQSRAVTAEDYERARQFLEPSLSGLVVGGTVNATWARDGRFWYRNTTRSGTEIVVIDPVAKSRTRCDPTVASCDGLAISTNNWQDGGRSRRADRLEGGPGGPGEAGDGARGGTPPLSLSPDGRRGVFVRDWNLWVRDVDTGAERQLTHDGVQYFGYATDNAGWTSSDRALVRWSPDSKRLATQQQDERNVGEMYLLPTVVGHPNLTVRRMPLPGDTAVAMLHRVVIDVDARTITRLRMPPDFHRGTIGDNVRMDDYQWNADGTKLAIASMSRDYKRVWLSIADAATGAVREVYEEVVPTQFEAHPQWQVLWATNELVWPSERDDWSQLYLYDLTTGAIENQITRGDGPVRSILRLDERSRTVWFSAQGKEPGEDPYFRHIYRVGLDGKHLMPLTPGVGDHTAQLSPDAKYVVDSYSQPDVPPVVMLRDGATGAPVMPLEKADISELLATGWKPPIPIKMTARNGKTAIYGLMFVPTRLDPHAKYPVINNIYPGPEPLSVGSRSFAAARGDRQALAELGFVVVSIDGMGTTGRSKSFQDAYYGAMGRDNTIPDQIAGMRQLAQEYPFIDIERVGVWGHSGGGFATTSAMFRHPDFFKVGIAESGNQDQRAYHDDWGERYQGLLIRSPNGTDNYEAEANQNFAKNLTGHLMLAHGTMDDNVAPAETMLVVDALIKANKEFDLVLIPNALHGYGTASDWMMRRRWDYFVRWLAGGTPPVWNEEQR
jgi:dipeptidyl aminopeptidase/acylaminoacyl peptidase